MKCPFCLNDDKRLLEVLLGGVFILCTVCAKVFVVEENSDALVSDLSKAD